LIGKHPARLALTRHVPLHVQHNGIPQKPFNQWESDPTQTASRNWLPLPYTTYAEALKKRGYSTGFVGKWHLGHEPYYPIHQGFDEQFGVTREGAPKGYYPPYFRFTEPYPDAPDDKYLTQNLTEDAVDFIEKQDEDTPWHLSLFYYNVHSPLEGPKALVRKFRRQGLSKKAANYAAMLKALDRSVGRVHEAIKQRADSDNTLILFAGDQGGRLGNEPFRGGKLHDQTYDGGCRVPFAITWPAAIEPGRVVEKPIVTTDWMATVADLVDVDRDRLSPLDGVSLVDVLLDRAPVPDRTVFLYRSYNNQDQGLRDGRWKLVRPYEGPPRLYDLHADPGEQHNLAEQLPQQTQVLLDQLQAWKALMGVPRDRPPKPMRAAAHQ
jgi:arylsulfatase A-like enzyme